MKFKYSGEAADIIAREMFNILPSLSPDTVITCVPTISSHLRQRGIDHTRRMSKELSRLTDLRFVDVLSRIGQNRQVGSTRQQRLSQMEDVFRCKNTFLIEGMDILLVDDVITTGATIESVAKQLKSAGAKSVEVIVFAKAK